MTLALFCAALAPVGWAPTRLTYALRVGEAARLRPHPIDDDLISTLAKTTRRDAKPTAAGSPDRYAFFASRSASGAGSPPPGLEVDAATGDLVGAPTIAGTYTVAVGIAGGTARITGPAFTVRVLPP